MSSNDIAVLTGKRHSDVLRDIRDLLSNINKSDNDGLHSQFVFKNSTYQGERRREKCILMNKAAYMLVLNRYNGLSRVPNRLQEEAALKTIEQLLSITLIRQYKVLEYRLDGYDPINNVAYEIDEPEHRYKTNQDKERQLKIKKVLKCTFVRIKL